MTSERVFGLDEREIVVRVGDYVLFSENNTNNVCKVLDIRCVEGNYEVRVAGPNGGWKRTFYKLANEFILPE